MGECLHRFQKGILVSLYSGNVCIWNYQTQTKEKSFKVTESPVRSAKFIARKHWIVTGADDKFVRVYNYNTMELIKEFEAHTDYIRCLSIHPTLPCVLSTSDDKLIKIWDWEKDWECTRSFEGHSYYVMQAIWNLGSSTPVATLDGHSKGINCVHYFLGGEKPLLLSGSDDQTVKVWDYETKSCVQTLEGHKHNVTAISTHPEFSLIFTVSED
ncbi:hypothetical protein Tsubulata_033563 [Turnera subulata]|uniref:Coatomer WD associated region domain-containing protein n=1 Tax=Turnera subulata TaxID=218843 RepID=A0A9Q0GML5_9ROSI|nr:hypothetical protein Tsubulata_033563 [Turnera subulata]